MKRFNSPFFYTIIASIILLAIYLSITSPDKNLRTLPVKIIFKNPVRSVFNWQVNSFKPREFNRLKKTLIKKNLKPSKIIIRVLLLVPEEGDHALKPAENIQVVPQISIRTLDGNILSKGAFIPVNSKSFFLNRGLFSLDLTFEDIGSLKDFHLCWQVPHSTSFQKVTWNYFYSPRLDKYNFSQIKRIH